MSEKLRAVFQTYGLWFFIGLILAGLTIGIHRGGEDDGVEDIAGDSPLHLTGVGGGSDILGGPAACGIAGILGSGRKAVRDKPR